MTPSAPLLLAAILSLPADPALDDLQRFAPPPAAKEALAFNRRCHTVLTARAECELYREWWWTETLAELDGRYYIWDALADAQNGSQGVPFRRRSLGRLRELIGPAAYAAGRLPACVPVERFTRAE